MPFVVSDNRKPFEKPDSGVFAGTLADVVDLGIVPTQYGAKAKVRFIWVLDKNDSEGRPFRVMRQFNAHLNEKGDLFKAIKDILGTAPPASYDLESLIGRANQLVALKETVNGKVFVNVKGILPLGNLTAPKIPADFVRSKDKKNQPATAAASIGNTAQAPAPEAEVADEDIPF